MSPLTCPICGDRFEQTSRYDRHMAAAHPPSALTAADLERALTGIAFPESKAKLVEYVGRTNAADSAVMRAVLALPDRVYRDAAEIAIAFGESKGSAPPRPAEEVAREEPPGRRGGRVAATEAPSAAAVAKILGGIHFPASKDGLLAFARSHKGAVEEPDAVLGILQRFPERSFRNMADVEVEVGKVARAA